MATKPQSRSPEDDWAGLAQNLFGIDLAKGGNDDDLLDDDMFKVEIPKPPEPALAAAAPVAATTISDAEVSFSDPEPVVKAVVAEVAVVPAPRSTPPVAKPVTARKPVVLKAAEDSFGAGLDEFATGISEQIADDSDGIALPDEDDDGLTLADDFDTEGLTLPSDYDDGLTLPPETSATNKKSSASLDLDDSDSEDDLEDEDEESEDSGEVAQAGPSDGPRRRVRRTREDAYWDLLENWQWEEIGADDAPRADRDQSRGGSGRDRGGRGGDRSRRGSSGSGSRRPEKDFSAEKAQAQGRPVDAPKAASEDRPQRSRTEERKPSESEPRRSDVATTSTSNRETSSTSSERPRRPQDRDQSQSQGDRKPRSDRGPRADRPPSERRPREDRPRDEQTREPAARPVQAATPPSSAARPAVVSSGDDFGLGVFDEQAQAKVPTKAAVPAPAAQRGREEVVAQSSQAADKVLRGTGFNDRNIDDELVWPDDDSDVRPAPVGSVVETQLLPAADADEPSDARDDQASDVESLEDSEENRRRPRRRRRRRGPRPVEGASTESNEGTTFDLTEALTGTAESPDFIPEGEESEQAESSEPSESTTTEEGGERRRPRRRRRRRRPDDAPAAVDSEGNVIEQAEDNSEDSQEDEPVPAPTISYANIPSWEEAIRYMLQPHLVGRNLGPDDEIESLEGDPRGSGGSEPNPPPQAARRRRPGGSSSGGRGGRRDPRSSH